MVGQDRRHEAPVQVQAKSKMATIMKMSSEKIASFADVIDDYSCDPKHHTSFHIAVLYKRGKVVEMASNAVGSRSKGCGYSKHTIHAERAVLKKVGDTSQLKGTKLFVVRLSGRGEILSSEPCHSCQVYLTKCMREYGMLSAHYS